MLSVTFASSEYGIKYLLLLDTFKIQLKFWLGKIISTILTLSYCYGLDMKCPQKGHVLKTWSPAGESNH
jgi:hypothetical protein